MDSLAFCLSVEGFYFRVAPIEIIGELAVEAIEGQALGLDLVAADLVSHWITPCPMRYLGFITI